MSIIDIASIISFLAPVPGEWLGFLRVLRTVRLLRTYHMLAQLRQDFPFFRKNEDVIFASLNMAVFLFVMTGLVYETQHRANPEIGNYADALYFTVTALTTTGFGDITLPGTERAAPHGRDHDLRGDAVPAPRAGAAASAQGQLRVPVLRPVAPRPRRGSLQGLRHAPEDSRTRARCEMCRHAKALRAGTRGGHVAMRHEIGEVSSLCAVGRVVIRALRHLALSGDRFLSTVRLVRSVLLALCAAVVLAACSAMDYDMERSERSRQPIPSKLAGEMSAKNMTAADPILIRLYKQESELELWKRDNTGRYALLKTYPICRWSGKLGPKTKSGDRQAPEGFYSVAARQMNPDSNYYLSFNLGFPNKLESALGYSGALLMIHGACSSAGCYAITDKAAAEIYTVARESFRGGQVAFQVQALPFRMTPENLALHRDDPHMAFWSTLKEGSDHFEVTRQEPRVGACGGRYVFNGTNMGELDPLAPCPADIGVDPTLAAAVAAKQAQDAAEVASILAVDPQLPHMSVAVSYVDGGMHESFRSILERSGPQRLARMTSERAPVSRPEAALADPYDPDVLFAGIEDDSAVKKPIPLALRALSLP